MKDITTKECELILVLINTAIHDHERLAEFTAAPDQCRKHIEEYEILRNKIIYYTIGRRMQDERESQGEGLRQGEKAGEPVV